MIQTFAIQMWRIQLATRQQDNIYGFAYTVTYGVADEIRYCCVDYSNISCWKVHKGETCSTCPPNPSSFFFHKGILFALKGMLLFRKYTCSTATLDIVAYKYPRSRYARVAKWSLRVMFEQDHRFYVFHKLDQAPYRDAVEEHATPSILTLDYLLHRRCRE
jgi:hypothetical protein